MLHPCLFGPDDIELTTCQHSIREAALAKLSPEARQQYENMTLGQVPANTAPMLCFDKLSGTVKYDYEVVNGEQGALIMCSTNMLRSAPWITSVIMICVLVNCYVVKFETYLKALARRMYTCKRGHSASERKR